MDDFIGYLTIVAVYIAFFFLWRWIFGRKEGYTLSVNIGAAILSLIIIVLIIVVFILYAVSIMDRC